jgi:di/tripeptidase
MLKKLIESGTFKLVTFWAVESLKRQFQKVSVEPVVVGQYAAWDPQNDRLIKKLCSKTYASMLKKMIVSGMIR